MTTPSNREFLSHVRAWAAVNCPGCPFLYLEIHCQFLPVPIQLADGPGSRETPPDAPAASEPVWEPTDYQCMILDALEYKALRSDALHKALGGDRARIWKKNGIKELEARGLVRLDKSSKRLGYYRPDAPPPELEEGA